MEMSPSVHPSRLGFHLISLLRGLSLETPCLSQLKSENHVFLTAFFYAISFFWTGKRRLDERLMQILKRNQNLLISTWVFKRQKEESNYQRWYMFLYRIGVYQMRFEADLTIVETKDRVKTHNYWASDKMVIYKHEFWCSKNSISTNLQQEQGGHVGRYAGTRVAPRTVRDLIQRFQWLSGFVCK